MPVLTCDACNKEFQDEAEQKLHCRSKWHRYNLKRKAAGVSGVTEASFQARQSALAEERNKSSATTKLYTCALCREEYGSSKAHARHLKSQTHSMRTSQESDPAVARNKTIMGRPPNRSMPSCQSSAVGKDSKDEWVLVDPDDDELEMASESLANLHVNEQSCSSADQSHGMIKIEDLDPACCFMCDQKHHDIKSCMVHMHKRHGFFIPDVEYLKDPKGLLTYVGLKVKRDFMCLYCNERCHPFQSLEAVRMHMIAKGHCKLRYGDGGDDDDGDFEDFYDYSSSYLDADGKHLVTASDMANNVELGTGGYELTITRSTDRGVLVRTLGSRELLRYYCQKPRPSPARDSTGRAILLASRYQNMRLATVESKERIVTMKFLRKMNRNGVEAMRSKIGMKSNVIRNLPKNVPY